ncbi:hypothetical protein NLI96_g12421 [Meripilus lineatus]|uniref:Uncharacterized protein n=1 Tax=Meripilus lineatus TaxID=2056292 RepID=A0AAD5UTX4_9APHY|nr:hypothetical protein NLI96_g12421 [Physisporinus lineatus]
MLRLSSWLSGNTTCKGIEADPKKVEKILDWPIPKSSSDMHSFLGLVRYVASFLPNLAQFTSVLTPLTTKDCNRKFPPWTSTHQTAFDAIKTLVISRECLTTIDHDNMGDNRIFVACDASDRRTGAVLTYGPTKESARPIAFDSTQLKGPELNYPVHEKELLAIVHALKKCAADALSRLPDDISIIAAITHSPVHTLCVASDLEWLQRIRDGYKADSWCRKLANTSGFSGIREEDGLLFVGSRLIIPRIPEIRESLFHLAHDSRGHFGFEKSYSTLRDDFYWPNMLKEIETIVAIDFVGPLPSDSGFNAIATFTDRLGADLQIVPTRTDIDPTEFALTFFQHWYCENGLPLKIISD